MAHLHRVGDGVVDLTQDELGPASGVSGGGEVQSPGEQLGRFHRQGLDQAGHTAGGGELLVDPAEAEGAVEARDGDEGGPARGGRGVQRLDQWLGDEQRVGEAAYRFGPVAAVRGGEVDDQADPVGEDLLHPVGEFGHCPSRTGSGP